MTRRTSTALSLCALLVGLFVVGVAVDTGPADDRGQLTAFVDAPDLEAEFDVAAPLLVAALGTTLVALARGPWTAIPRARQLVSVPVVGRRAPARGPPTR